MLPSCLRFYVSYAKIVDVFQKVQQVNAKSQKKTFMQALLNSLSLSQIKQFSQLFSFCENKFARLSERSIKTLAINQLKIPEDQIAKQLEVQNDISLAISKMFTISKAKRSNLELEQVIEYLHRIGAVKGTGSVADKSVIVQQLLKQCDTPEEIEYIIRVLINKLNIGMSQKSLNELIEWFSVPKGAIKKLQVAPMLCKPLPSIEQAVTFSQKKGGVISAEIKYDGERTFIYYERGVKIRLVSRNNKEQNEVYPDLVDRILNELNQITDLASCILDAEIICVEKHSSKPMNIQTLLSRKGSSRQSMDKSVVQKIMVFDVISLNSKSLSSLPYTQRKQLIPIPSKSLLLQKAESKLFTLPQDTKQFVDYFKDIVQRNYEGLILKPVNTVYDCTGSRAHWAKLKKDCLIGQNSLKRIDLDMVLLGAEKRKGRKSQIYGSFLFGVKLQNDFVPICKVGTGLSDDELEALSKQINERAVSQVPQNYRIPESLQKDIVFCRPEIVYAITAQQFSRSPVYELDKTDKGGISLRFPRFERRRMDKSVEQANHAEDVIDLCTRLV